MATFASAPPMWADSCGVCSSISPAGAVRRTSISPKQTSLPILAPGRTGGAAYMEGRFQSRRIGVNPAFERRIKFRKARGYQLGHGAGALLREVRVVVCAVF